MNAQHFVIRVCEQPRVDRDKILGAGLRRARLGSSSLLRVEDVRRYLHKFAEEHSINRDLEGHDRKAVLFSKTSGKVARGVRYDVNSHRRVATSPGRESQTLSRCARPQEDANVRPMAPGQRASPRWHPERPCLL